MTTVTRPIIHQGIDAFSDQITPPIANELADYASTYRDWYQRLVSDRPLHHGLRPPQITIDSPLPMALNVIVDELNIVLALHPNWDSYGGRPSSFTAAISALSWILEIYEPEMPTPSVVPCPDGSIQLEWHIHGIDFEVLFLPSGATEFCFEDHETGQAQEGHLSIQNLAGRAFVDQLIERSRR